MRLHASAPVEWPSLAALDEVWRPLAELPERPEILHGAPGSDRVVLDAGVHGRPGARYHLDAPLLTKAALTGAIDGSGTSRRVAVRLSGTGDPGLAASVDADGPDAPRTLRTEGRLGPLAWSGELSIERRAAQLEARLPWARGELTARVQRRLRGDVLEVDCEATGRGLTRPILATLGLALSTSDAQTGFSASVQELAQHLTRIAQGWRPDLSLPPATSRGPVTPADPVDWDAALDLGWLRSPLSTLRHLQQLETTFPTTRKTAPAPRPDPLSHPASGPGSAGALWRPAQYPAQRPDAGAPVVGGPSGPAGTPARTDPPGLVRPRRRLWPRVLVGAVVAGVLAFAAVPALTRDPSPVLRLVPGVTEAERSEFSPTLYVTLADSPDAAAFDRLLAVVRGLRGTGSPERLNLTWSVAGRERSLYLDHLDTPVSGGDLAALPVEPDHIGVGENPSRTAAHPLWAIASCAPERILADCVRPLRSPGLELGATEIEPAEAPTGATHLLWFSADDADRVGEVYRRVRAAAPTALSLIVTGDAGATGRRGAGAPVVYDEVRIAWGYRPGAAHTGPATPPDELIAVARTVGELSTPVSVDATIDQERNRAEWRTDRCIDASEPLNRTVHAALQASGRPALQPPGCPAP